MQNKYDNLLIDHSSMRDGNMQINKDFIEAIKRCIHANVMVWRKMGGAGEEKARKEYSEAEAHLDSFGGEKKEVKPQDETLQEEEVERRSMFPGKGW